MAEPLPESPSEIAPSPSSFWTAEQNKLFESVLAIHDEETEDRWEKVAEIIGKDPEEVKKHYEVLLEDVDEIEAGRVPLPNYASASNFKGDAFGERNGQQGGKKELNSSVNASFGLPNPKSTLSKADQERRKGIPWSEEEHRRFLLGLEKFGKGDWRSISRNFVITRTPTQVASHAQKFFIRRNSMHKDKRRSSIHDITSFNNGEPPETGQTPVTGHAATPSPHVQGILPMGNVYAVSVGQPITAPMGPAVGTPVAMPHPGSVPYLPRPHLAAQPGVSGVPLSMAPVVYSMPQPALHN